MKRMPRPSRTTPTEPTRITTSIQDSSDRQCFTLADDQFRGQNNFDTTTAATVSVSLQLYTASEDNNDARRREA